MPVGAAIAGAAVIGGGTQIISGNKAAKATKSAAAQQLGESGRQYDLTRADYAPWRAAGQTALDTLMREYTNPGASSFTASPGYQFRRDEGVKAVERSASSRGLLRSGAAVKGIERFAEGNAAGEYGDWWNRLAGISGVGQAATGSTAQAGENAASRNIAAIGDAGNARASSYINTGSAVNSGINNVLSAYLFQTGGGGYNPGAGRVGTTVPGYGNA